MMRIDFFYENIFIPVFEDKLKDYFSDMFNSYCGILFYPDCKIGNIMLDLGLGYAKEIVSFEFLTETYKRSFNGEEFCFLNFRSKVLSQFLTEDKLLSLPQCFKEKYEFVYHVTSFEGESIDINKKVFLKDFIHYFGLTNSYVEFDKVREKKKIDKLMGEEVF